MIIYQGPSLIDGSPIVAIAIAQSGNVKTGNMVQTYIIRADMSPMEASKQARIIQSVGIASFAAIRQSIQPERLRKSANAT